LQIITTGEYEIKNIKSHVEHDKSKIRITFDWPADISQVFIFAVQACNPDSEFLGKPGLAEIGHRLFTLQEYKKYSGFITEKIRGETSYFIYPSTREGEGYILYEHSTGNNCVNFIEKTTINCQIKEKMSWGIDKKHTNHQITISSDYSIEENILCYVKKKNAPPIDITDGKLYYFTEAIEPGRAITRIVRTMKNEYVQMFVSEEMRKLYGIIQT